MDEEVTPDGTYHVVDGIRTHIVRQGAGETLVLLHGLGGPLMWERVLEPLSQHFHVVVVDLPGFGVSDPPPLPFTTEQYCEFLSHLLENLGIGKTIIAGLSYGGQLAVNFVQRHPRRVTKLILVDSSGLLSEQAVFNSAPFWFLFRVAAKHIVLRSRFLLCAFGRLTFYRKASRPQDYCQRLFDQLSAPGKRDAWLNGLRNVFAQTTEFPRLLTAISIPTLILWGAYDRTTRVKYAHIIHRHIPHAQVVIVPESAHSVPLEQPERFVRAVVEFAGQG